MPTTTVFYSRFSRILAAVIVLGCVVAAAAVAVTGSGENLLRTLPPLVLVGFLAWAMFWQPAVVVDEHGVELRNVFRSIRIAWSDITTVDTRWALAVSTQNGRYSAWAAPASGRHGLYRITAQENRHLAETAYANGTIRTGDALSSDSGQAAQIVRSRWEYLRDRELLETPAAGQQGASISWHWATILITALAVVASLVSLG